MQSTDFCQYLPNLISAYKILTYSSRLGSVTKPQVLKWEVLDPQCSQGFVLVIPASFFGAILSWPFWLAFAHHEQMGQRTQVILGWCLV